MTDKTLDYYNNNAEIFVKGTVDVLFNDVQDKFISYMPKQAYILDFGCGSGRDTKYFLQKGLRVDAIDGSEKLCEIASEHTGIKVKHMLFSELDASSCYDGIWACSSVLHLSKEELKEVFFKMIKALKPGGYLYTSFKYGVFEGYRNGRYFTDFTEENFSDFTKDIQGISPVERWISKDARPGREDEKWLNLILKKL